MGVPKCCGQTTCTDDMPPKNDKRCQLINEVKELIGNIEHGEKRKPRESRRPDRPGVPGMRDVEEECTRWRKRRDCTPPLITKIALHETRPTSDYTNMRLENSSQVTYVDATNEGKEFRKVPPAPWDLPRKPSQELRSGELYLNCRCLKRDGLQHDCPRWECGGRPECVAVNPGPCCIPSQWPKPIRGDKRYGNRQAQGEGATISYEGRQLKTGPLCPEICEPMGPMGAQQQFGGRGGQQGQVLGFTVGGHHQHQGHQQHQNVGGNIPQATEPMGAQQHFGWRKVDDPQPLQPGEVLGITGGHQQHQGHHQHQNVRGNIPQATPPTGVVMVLDLSQIQPGAQHRQVQNQEVTQTTMLQGPGVTCCCRPA